MIKLKYSILIIMALLSFCIAGPAQKRPKEEPKLPTVSIRSTIDAVRGGLISSHLTDGFTLCGDEPHQLSFCKPVSTTFLAIILDPEAGFGRGLQFERVFTLAADGDHVTIFALEHNVVKHRIGNDDRIPIKPKDSKTVAKRMRCTALQDVMDKLKDKLEAQP
jgi:hypothetical protein